MVGPRRLHQDCSHLGNHGSLFDRRLNEAFHDEICECRILPAMFPTVAYMTCTEEGNMRVIEDTRRGHHRLVSLKDFSLQGCTEVWKITDIYIDLSKR